MDRIQNNFWKQLVRIDFIMTKCQLTIKTPEDSSKSTKQREIEFYLGKLNQVPLFSLGDFRDQWLFVEVALGEYLNTDVDNILKD